MNPNTDSASPSTGQSSRLGSLFSNIKLFAIATFILVFSTLTVGVLTTRYITEKEGVLEISLIQSNIRLVNQTLENIEQQILKEDRRLYELTAILGWEDLSQKLEEQSITRSPLVKHLYLFDPQGNILFSDCEDHPHRRLIQQRIYPQMARKRIPLQSIHHLHTSVNAVYYLFSILKFQAATQQMVYTLVMEFNLENLGAFFDPFIHDLAKNYQICIQDYENNVIYGEAIEDPRKYFAEQRFPNTFYRWMFQLSPRNAAEIEQDERNRRALTVALIVINLVLILSAWFLVYMGRKREVRLTRQKEEFIRNVSHEMKTPLSLIKMFSEILILGRKRDEITRQEYLGIIFAETERLTFLVNNVLDFSNLERGLQKFCFEEMDLAALVSKHLEVFDYRIKKENVHLHVDIAPDLPSIEGDSNALALVLLNLLDNAIKYSSDGRKDVHIRLFREENDVVLVVRDYGIGISPQDLPRIFEKFYRSNHLSVRRIRGSGIGLSLVRYIVDAHNGRIAVESTPDQGTEFTIRIPRYSPPSET
ncbi:MAG: HAMP domain-containing histidine kinase [Acidobacteria bacterium]|nr:HAMP domain-containing histidine kinase [Acidobacteriota bacterium]